MAIYFKVQVNGKNGVEKKIGEIRGQANNTFPLNSKVSPEFDMSFPWERHLLIDSATAVRLSDTENTRALQ